MEETPSGFVFAVKASRYLTHVRRLRDVGDGSALFYERMGPLVRAGKLGPVVWQLPPNFRRDDERLAAALGALGQRAGTASSSVIESWFESRGVRPAAPACRAWHW